MNGNIILYMMIGAAVILAGIVVAFLLLKKKTQSSDIVQIRQLRKGTKEPKGNLAVPPFYCYRACDVKRIQEALENGCGYDAPGSFAAWLSKQTPMHAYVMPGKRYDIGDINSYEYVKSVFSK